MWFLLFLIVFVLTGTKYLQYKKKVSLFNIVLIVLSFNALLGGGLVIGTTISERRVEKEFNEKIQYPADKANYGFIQYDSLTDEEKDLYNRYMRQIDSRINTDGLFIIIMPFIFLGITIVEICLHVLIDSLRFLIGKTIFWKKRE